MIVRPSKRSELKQLLNVGPGRSSGVPRRSLTTFGLAGENVIHDRPMTSKASTRANRLIVREEENSDVIDLAALL